MTPEERAIPACKIVSGDRCAVCRKQIDPSGFWHTCGWLFCSQTCSDIGSEEAVAHEGRIAEAICTAILEEREACAQVAEAVSQRLYEFDPDTAAGQGTATAIAAAIRARGEKS